MTTYQLENAELQRIANDAAPSMDATADEILSTVYGAYKAWCRARRLHFPPDRRRKLLLEVLRYCIDQGNVIEGFPALEMRYLDIALMLDGRYPRYARHLAR